MTGVIAAGTNIDYAVQPARKTDSLGPSRQSYPESWLLSHADILVYPKSCDQSKCS